MLDLHTREASTLSRAADVLDRLDIGTPAIDPETQRCSIDAPQGSGVLALVVRALDDAGIDIEDITVRQPTLGRALSYVDFLVPGFVATSVLFTGMGASAGVADDLGLGLMDRLRSLPISRFSIIDATCGPTRPSRP